MNDAIALSTPTRSEWRLAKLATAIRKTLGAAYVIAGLVSVVACSLSALLLANGAKLVITDSIPRGLYVPEPGAIERSVVAGGCMPREVAERFVRLGSAIRGGCPGGVLPFFKIVAAVAGDTVVETSSAVSINGASWPWSGPQFADVIFSGSSSRHRSYVVRSGEVLLLGLNPHSFDGRYFGPTPLAALERYRPLSIERTQYTLSLEHMIADRQRLTLGRVDHVRRRPVRFAT